MRRIFYFLSLTVLGTSIYVYNQFNVTRQEYQKLISEHTAYHFGIDSNTNKKNEKFPPNLYFEREHALEMNPRTGRTSPENIEVLKASHQSRARFRVPGESDELAWLDRGPDNIGGRTRVLFYDPNDTSGKRVFAGGVSGGLWVNNDITDENSLWVQIGIDENLSVSCYAIDPNDSNIWYVGTGESYTNNDGTGNGLWKTTNGGASWASVIDINFDQDEPARVYFLNQIIAWNNGGSTELFLAIDGAYDYDFVGYSFSGWWQQTSADFSRVVHNTPENSPYVYSDIEIAPDNSMWFATKNNVYGHGGGKIFRSTNGVDFTEKYSFTNGDRVELSVSKQNSNTVYAVAEIFNKNLGEDNNVKKGVQLVKTLDGLDFIEISKPNDVDQDITPEDFTRGQAFYDLMLEVDPDDDNIVYAGGIDLFKSYDGGNSWSQISKWSNNNDLFSLRVSLVHADQHTLAFSPLDHNQGVFGNDGGVYFCEDLSSVESSTSVISSRNKNYNVTQFYSAAIGQNINNEMLLGGAQDNGSLFVSNAAFGMNSYIDLYGGDGAKVFIDKDDDYAIVSYVFNTYILQPLPLLSYNNQILIEKDEESGTFINTADLDDQFNLLYTDGTTGYRNDTLDIAPAISRFSNLKTTPERDDFTDPLLSEAPTAIKVSPFTVNSSSVLIGTETGILLKVTGFETENPLWTSIDNAETINVGAVSDISFGANEDEIVVTLHNYGINNIYFTTDGGINWVEKDGNLPDIPTKAILLNPLDQNEAIVGTNFGVWRTENFRDELPIWVHSQNGMSSVKVTQFDMRKTDQTVLASTYGRGLFTGHFSGVRLSNSIADIQNDLNSVFRINRIDKTLEIKKNVPGDEVVNVCIYKMDGALMLARELNFMRKSKHLLEVPFQSGVYLVNISYGTQHFSQKIVLFD
jgi:photosystem II stability/assembly factor-like uncharacterized protein